jgi:colanic acid biosynthesis glycosyl transferase WcaI
MHVLIVSQYFWPEDFRINDLARELAGKGHRITVLTGKPNYPAGSTFPEYRRDPGSYASFGGAKIVRVPMVSRGTSKIQLLLNYLSFALSGTVVGAWLLRAERFDIVFVFEPSPITVGIPGAVIGRLHSAPVVLWVLDLWPETLVAIGVLRSRAPIWAVGRMVAAIYRSCDVVLGQSRSFLAAIAIYKGTSRGIEYFPAWTDTHALSDGHPQEAPELPPPDGRITIMFTGNIGEAQDFPSVLRAAAMLAPLRRFRFFLIGGGRAEAWVRQEVMRCGLQDSVYLLGRFPVERMAGFYRQADALFVSLRKDAVFAMTIPAKIQSYMAAGVPIIAMLDGEGSSLIQRAHCGLCCPAGASESLADRLLEFSKLSGEVRHEMGLNGRRVYHAEFDRAMLINKLEARLLELVNGRRAKEPVQ